MLKRSPAAALAACRELIRAAEGACLGLRVTLSMQAPWGEVVVGLRAGGRKEGREQECQSRSHFSSDIAPVACFKLRLEVLGT